MNTKTKTKTTGADIKPVLLHCSKRGADKSLCGAPKRPDVPLIPGREVPKEWRCPKCQAIIDSRN